MVHAATTEGVNLATHLFGWGLLMLFVVGYYFIAQEEKYHLDKAKPALFVGTLMYILIGGFYAFYQLDFAPFQMEITHLIYEIAEIFFFLFVAMTFVEVLIERQVFNVLKENLLTRGYGYRQLFWITGFLAFFISPIADNLTTALILSTVLITIEKENLPFLLPSAVNIVVASNAGGAWSPFGDITTLMAWTAQKGEFTDFLYLFPASFLGWLVTAVLLARYIPAGAPLRASHEHFPKAVILKGGRGIVAIGIGTIALSIITKQVTHLPPMWGMLFGLSLLQLYVYTLKERHHQEMSIFRSMSKIENNTLLFFFGILASVGALHFMGFLAYVTQLYAANNPIFINIALGFLSAIIDNVPVMSAVLKANPSMDHVQWMLVVLTAGIGGSLISFGSAAGVGVMGKLKGVYTFSSHNHLAWAVLVGYGVSVGVWYVQFILLGIG
ncbi:MAG: sodium:proton antiporter NhaD [Sulfuricurvum sp.]